MDDVERVARAAKAFNDSVRLCPNCHRENENYTFSPGALADLNAAIAAMQGWRPIETAPRDGTSITLWDANGYSKTGSWREDEYMPERGKMWLDDSFDDFSTSFASAPLEPTHWMPLPEPPKD